MKLLFLPTLEPATVMPVSVTDLVGGLVMEFALYLPWFAPEENLRS
jgi:hypothetical protein